jgi:hypothetical protein
MFSLVDMTLELAKTHQGLAVPVILKLAIVGSRTFASLLISATIILCGIGELTGAAVGAMLDVWLSCTVCFQRRICAGHIELEPTKPVEIISSH